MIYVSHSSTSFHPLAGCSGHNKNWDVVPTLNFFKFLFHFARQNKFFLEKVYPGVSLLLSCSWSIDLTRRYLGRCGVRSWSYLMVCTLESHCKLLSRVFTELRYTYLIRKRIFEWYVVWCGSKNRYQKDMFKRDWIMCWKYDDH